MVMRINGLGHGPLADRQLLGERQQRGRDAHDEPARHEKDRVERRLGRAEQMRAEFAAINGAIQHTEDALAIASLAQSGLERVAQQLDGLAGRLAPLAAAEATPRAQGPPDWLGEALAAIEEVAETTRFGALRLLDGSLGCSGTAVGDGLEFVAAGPQTRSSPPQGYEVLLSREPTRATLLAERPLTAEAIAAGVQLVLREGGRTARLTTRAGQTPGAVAAALHAEVRRAGLSLTVEVTADGRLVVQHTRFGAAHRFAAASSLPGVLSTPEGGSRLVANGRDIVGTLNGEPAVGEGQTLTGCAENVTTAGLVIRYTGLPFLDATRHLPRRPVSPLEPRTFAGRVVVAQQALPLRLGSEPGETMSLRLDSVRPAHLGRGVSTASGFAALADIRCGTPAEARDALALVAAAREQVERTRGALHGLVQGRLTASLAQLRVQAQNLAAASQDLLAPGAALQAVQALSRHILREARTALSAQAHPPQGSLLGLLGEEDETNRGPRWN